MHTHPKGQRLKKLEARKLREENEEVCVCVMNPHLCFEHGACIIACVSVYVQEERVKMDEDEARYQASKRREAIDKAKTTLYYQTDRVKQFHVSSNSMYNPATTPPTHTHTHALRVPCCCLRC